VWGCCAVPFLFSIIYTNLISVSFNMYGVAVLLFRLPQFWFTIILTPVLLLLPDFAAKLYVWMVSNGCFVGSVCACVFPSLSLR